VSQNLSVAAFVSMLKREPAAASFSVSAALVPILTGWFHWDARQAAAAAAILAAVSSVIAAVKARPVSVPLLYGGATAIISALAAWNLKLPAADMAAVTSIVTVLIGGHLRTQLTPVVALKPPSRLP
jgi:hypothetical protein